MEYEYRRDKFVAKIRLEIQNEFGYTFIIQLYHCSICVKLINSTEKIKAFLQFCQNATYDEVEDLVRTVPEGNLEGEDFSVKKDSTFHRLYLN